ncbi:YALIA101S07e05666g1_1 [Yarrowia lipolytica]|nr:YALIA101S07e05666g1_1 [Yarrowia lipolytica]
MSTEITHTSSTLKMVLTFEKSREKFLQIRDGSIAELDKLFPPPKDSQHHDKPTKLPKNSIPVFQQMMAPSDAIIVNTDPVELLDQLAHAKVSAVTVAGAFLRAAVIAQTLTNCLTELLPREALETAKKLDEHLEATGKTVGPLHGSSSGEGALIGLGASHLGLGTDIGGSIRGPAACSGIYGLRPSTGRVPIAGCDHPMHGSDSINGCIGPMTPSPKLLDLFMQVMSDAETWRYDPVTERSVWSPSTFKKKKLRVGYYSDDGYVTPHPPVTRAIEEYVSKIEKSNFDVEVELVPFTPFNAADNWRIITTLYFTDGGKWLKDELNCVGEPLTDRIEMIALKNPNCRRLNIEELWHAHDERDGFKWNLRQEWNKAGIDMLIAPSLPGAAFKFGTSNYWGYTSYWNLVDYASVSVPFSTVKASDKPAENFKPRNKLDAEWQAHYSPEIYEGAPLSIQLIAPRMHDEVIVEALKMFSDIQ